MIMVCGVPQAMRPLLFLSYLNGSRQTSKFLKPTMSADDKNLFCKSKTRKTLFLKAIIELQKISEYF